MSPPTGYSIASYGEMISNSPRMSAYVDALRCSISEGSVVLDIGAGTGVCTLLACKFGARHVYAIEPDPAIEVARLAAARNGYSQRITFFQEVSTAVVLPERVDVIVSDLRGVLPLLEGHIATIQDARTRFLGEQGVLIPQKDRLWVTLIHDERRCAELEEPWLRNDLGLDLVDGHPFVTNNWRRASVRPEQLLVAPQCWAELDYRSIADPNLSGTVAWVAEREATAHGLLVWFESTLCAGVGFSNAPDQPELVYGQAFFPLQSPLAMQVGDRVEVSMRAQLNGADYVWRWNTSRFRGGKTPDFRLQQSSFAGTPRTLSNLRRRAASHVAELTWRADADRCSLDLLVQCQPLGEVARALQLRFPQHFPRFQDALTHVADLAERYRN